MPPPAHNNLMKTDQSIIQGALDHFRQTHEAYKNAGIQPSDYLGFIWAQNIEKHLWGIIHNCKSTAEAIAGCNARAFYDYTCTEPFLSASLRWRLQFLKDRHGFDMEAQPESLQESANVEAARRKTIVGRELSSDFLNRIMWLERVSQTVPVLEKPLVVMELGGGYGALVRAIKLRNPGARFILVDIPESLFFQEIFLRNAFPDAGFQYLGDFAEVPAPTSDFVFVPNKMLDGLKGFPVDLFVNTNALGEMPNPIVQGWFDFLQGHIQADYCFTLNRFLNRNSTMENIWRKEHNNCNMCFDPLWEILDWEVDPPYERCPIGQTIFTRNLHLSARRLQAPAGNSEQTINDLIMHDWNIRPYWDNYVLKIGGNYPPLHSRADHDMTADLTISGTLFALWDACRLGGGNPARELMLKYLDYLNDCREDVRFEEMQWLASPLEK